STTDQIRAALVDKNTALNLYTRARGLSDQRNENANYLTPAAELYRNVVADSFHEQAEKVADLIDESPFPELLKTVAKAPVEILDKDVAFDFKGAIQAGQDAVHSVTGTLREAIDEWDLPAPVADVASLPLSAADGLANFVAGADKHVVSIGEGLANIVVHPADTVSGLAQLGGRLMETTPEGRTALFLKDLATGRFQTAEEALQGMRDSVDPALMVKAGLNLGEDLLKGVFSEAIRLTKEGKYDEAAGNVTAQIVETVLTFGTTKVGALNRAGHVLNDARRVDGAFEAAQAVQRLDRVDDLARLEEVMFQPRGFGAEPATDELLAAMKAKGRTVAIAREGSEELRYLDHMGAEANVGGENLTHILLREDPTKIAALEEFLHGTQSRLRLIERLGEQA